MMLGRDRRMLSRRIRRPLHRHAAKVPGTEFEVELMEFRGAERQPVSVAIHDTGAGVLRLVVRDVDGLLQSLKAAGVPVVTAGGEPVSVGDRHFVILRDPDNFFFQIVPQPNAAPRRSKCNRRPRRRPAWKAAAGSRLAARSLAARSAPARVAK